MKGSISPLAAGSQSLRERAQRREPAPGAGSAAGRGGLHLHGQQRGGRQQQHHHCPRVW